MSVMHQGMLLLEEVLWIKRVAAAAAVVVVLVVQKVYHFQQLN